MHQSIDKYKKIYLYIFLFIFVTSIFNLNIMFFLNNIFKVKIIELNKSIYKSEFDQIYDQNIFKINKAEIVKILNKFPIIESFKINIVYPNKLKINLVETEPLAKIYLNNEIYYIGSNGNLFKKNEDFRNIPTITGSYKKKKINELFKIIKKIKFDTKKIDNLILLPSGRFDIIYDDQTVIKLPIENLEEILKKSELIYNDKKFKKKIIDLRIKNKIIISNE